MLPSPEAEPERYRGRPILLVLENYVLDCIGELAPERQQAMAGIVSRVFGGGPDWKATVRESLKLNESIDDHLRGMWARNQQVAKVRRTEMLPVQFAKIVADQNFADLIGPPIA
jgi:hypothetical protein